MSMTQIILDKEELPQTSLDKYACWEEELSVSLVMAAGNMVKEIKDPGKVWHVKYSYDYMGNELCRRVLAILRHGTPFTATVLPDNSDEPVISQFFCVSLTPPSFAFSRSGVPYWHNLAFELREVEPHA